MGPRGGDGADAVNITPTRKVGAGTGAGAASVVLVWALGVAGLTVPAEVASAITTLLAAVTAWLVPERRGV